MTKKLKFIGLLGIIFPSLVFSTVIANSASSNEDALGERIEYEEVQDSNPYAITTYEPNYVLPFNYTFRQSQVYSNQTPLNQGVKRTDFQFQVSLKTPIWRNFFGFHNALYIAYTQRSFWQTYVKSPYFRANNYQPEIFLQNNVEMPLSFGWYFQLFNVGALHQSNGRGGPLERSWNRIYVEGIFSKDNWLLSLRPWFILEESEKKNRSTIQHYIGHGRILIAYKFDDQVISATFYNNIESGFKRGTVQVNYSFPLIKKIKGYVQFFNGYGQSLIEYNHRTTAFGVGLSFSDWL
jgi:phospholipase A1